MKRVLSLLLLAALLLGALSGCKPSEPVTPDNSAAPAESEDYEEYDLPREDGTNRLVFYWYADGVDYSKCDMWIWYPGADGHGYPFHRCEYGAKVIVNVPQEITEVGFIVRRDCSEPGGSSWGEAVKDYDGDRFAAIEGDTTEVWLKPGDGAMYLSDDGGKTLYQAKKFTLAGIVAMDQIKYNVAPAVRIDSLDKIKVTEDGREIAIKELSSLNNEVVTGVITVAEPLDITKTYTVEIEGYGSQAAVPTGIFDSDEFNAEYAWDGELGAIAKDGGTEFRLWAPTAQSVKLKLYAEGAGGEPVSEADLEQSGHGVWSVLSDCGPGTYYTFTVTTALGTKEIVDPYAKAAGVNGDRGMVVDLGSTDPDGWEDDGYYGGVSSYNDAVIWEVHVRDFSNRITSSKYPGKYLAFTERGLVNESGERVGIDYLRDLGITHVHLQPVYDYATVDESSDEPQFNWGYDPKNYNVPEGSYSTDPYHGEVRIKEFKQMVQAIHKAGIGVVMDVVYNHTYSADSCFGNSVPYYYYRYNGAELSNGSGCGNETASERAMFRKYMVDSVTYWAEEYHVDGFRFDLMALHDIDTMQEIESAVHKINPHALIYGEGWTGGTTPLNPNLMANQANIGRIEATNGGIGAVAVFNDAIRDGLKGSVFDSLDRGYINGSASASTAARVIFGLIGGSQPNGVSWTVPDNAVINYMACHDNNTLWDKLAISNEDASEDERLLMNRLGASIVMISRGVPFFLAGEEMLRTKDGDHNSYKSSDAVNNIDWDALKKDTPVKQMHDFYAALISMRAANPFLRDADIDCEVLDANVIHVVWSDDENTVAEAWINPNAEPFTVNISGDHGALVDGWKVTLGPEGHISGSVAVEGRGILLVQSNQR